jgi:hypothetical protein
MPGVAALLTARGHLLPDHAKPFNGFYTSGSAGASNQWFGGYQNRHQPKCCAVIRHRNPSFRLSKRLLGFMPMVLKTSRNRFLIGKHNSFLLKSNNRRFFPVDFYESFLSSSVIPKYIYQIHWTSSSLILKCSKNKPDQPGGYALTKSNTRSTLVFLTL